MRVLQLIDSLNPGGAERVAINYANGLHENIEGSYLCSTREEGVLKKMLLPEIPYLFLRKRNALDVQALLKLRKFVKTNRINIIHAHTTSYFFACLLKLFYPSICLIWHEHNGSRVDNTIFNNKLLYFCSFFFNKIITVNVGLQDWCKNNLATKQVEYLPNFVDTSQFIFEAKKRQNIIVCLANLREPKNHLNLLKAFKQINLKFPEWKLYLVGRDKEDDYSNQLKEYILENNLQQAIILMGLETEIEKILQNSSIGVISSDSEGLPMALLEYGAAGLAVVSTKVGYCEHVISTFGRIVTPKDPEALANALEYYIESDIERITDGKALKNQIAEKYSLSTVLPKLLTIYKN